MTEWIPDFRKTRGRPKSMGGTSIRGTSSNIRGHKKAKNSQMEGEDPGLEVMEENHKRGKENNALEWERRKM